MMEVSNRDTKMVLIAFALGVAAHWAWQRIQWIDHPSLPVAVASSTSVISSPVPVVAVSSATTSGMAPVAEAEVLNPNGRYFWDSRKAGRGPTLEEARGAKNCVILDGGSRAKCARPRD